MAVLTGVRDWFDRALKRKTATIAAFVILSLAYVSGQLQLNSAVNDLKDNSAQDRVAALHAIRQNCENGNRRSAAVVRFADLLIEVSAANPNPNDPRTPEERARITAEFKARVAREFEAVNCDTLVDEAGDKQT